MRGATDRQPPRCRGARQEAHKCVEQQIASRRAVGAPARRLTHAAAAKLHLPHQPAHERAGHDRSN